MSKKSATKGRTRGQIISRGLDKWLVRVYLGVDPTTGKRKYRSATVHGPKREAEKKRTEMLSDIDQGTFVEPSKLSLGTYVSRWVDRQEHDVAPVTLRNYRIRVKHDILPYPIADLPIQDVEPYHVNDLLRNTLAGERSLSPHTIRWTFKILRYAFREAHELGVIKKNPMDHVKALKRPKSAPEVLSAEEVKLLLETTAGTRWGALWTFLLTTGCRPQEALALRWSDIEEPFVYFSRAVTRITSGKFKIADDMKTEGSRRKVRLPQGTIQVLKEHRVRQARKALSLGSKYDRDADLVFTTHTGGFIAPDHVYRKWRSALEKAGIKRVRLYDARHTHATQLLLSGVPVKVVSERLGHTSVATTMDVYSRVLPEMQEAAVDAVDAVYFDSPTPTPPTSSSVMAL